MGIESLEGQLNAKLLLDQLDSTPPKFQRAVITRAAGRFVHDYEEVLSGFDTLSSVMGNRPFTLKEVEDGILGSGRIEARLGFEPEYNNLPTYDHIRKTGVFVTRFVYENDEITTKLETRKFKLIGWLHNGPNTISQNPATEWPFNPELGSRVVDGTTYEDKGTIRVKPRNMVLAAEERYRRNIIDGAVTVAFLTAAIGLELPTS